MTLSEADDTEGEIRWLDYGPHASCVDKADDGRRVWRRVGRRLSEIPIAMDRLADGNLGGRVPGRRCVVGKFAGVGHQR